MVAFGSGSTPRFPEEPTPTKNSPVFGSIAMAVLMTLRDAEHALLGNQLGAVRAGYRLACFWRHFVCALLHRSTGAECTENVRYAPDAVLISDKNIAVLPS